MTIHEFSIIASGLDPQADDFEARFYEAVAMTRPFRSRRSHHR